jgi:hypothetical protein
MSVATEIARIQTDRNTIRNKLIDFGLAESTSNLDALATAVDGIINCGAVSAQVQEGDTYTIPKGYHNGAGTVSGVSGGGNYTLQSKTVTPTKKQQAITPDSGYYGLSDVTVGAIPEAYQDVSSVTAAAGDVLTGKIIVAADGTVTTGTMANNGAVSKTLTVEDPSYTVPKGYHAGTGTVSISMETKTVTPTTAQQTVNPTEGKVLSAVTVNAIPAQYVDTSDATATAAQILDGATAYAAGKLVEGAMPNNGAASKALDATTTSYTIPAGYHNGEGTVSVSLETKSATPTKSSQTISPTAGKLLSSVTVAAIPDTYQDVSGVTAVAADVLSGKTIVNAEGETVQGSMTNNGAVNGTIDGLTTTSYAVPAGYTSGGSVSLTGDIEDALAAI